MAVDSKIEWCDHTISFFQQSAMRYPHQRKGNEMSNEQSKPIPERIVQALSGERGGHQQMIARVALEVVETLLRKNADYGSSVFDPPVLMPGLPATASILVRLSDKIKRFQTLQTKKAEVNDESTDDTITDFIGYSILYRVAKEMKQPYKAVGERP